MQGVPAVSTPNRPMRSFPEPTPTLRVVDRYAHGPGAMLCDVCGYDYDPIGSRWMCPHCKTKHPCCDGAPLPPVPPLRG